MTRRAEVLRAVSEAASAFADSPTGSRTSFGIIGAVAARDIPLLFRPLDELWGAFITVNDEERGILVTTKLGLPAQRFTLAHELGHMLLGHRTSLDRTVEFAGRYAPASRPAQEAAAGRVRLRAARSEAPPARLGPAPWLDQGRAPSPRHHLSALAASRDRLPGDVLGSGHGRNAHTQRSRPDPGRIRRGLKRALPQRDRSRDPRRTCGRSRKPTAGGSSRRGPTTCSRSTFRTAPPPATSGAWSTRTQRPRSSANDRPAPNAPTARDLSVFCTSGSVRRACITSSSSTSDRGAGPRWRASRSKSTGTAGNAAAGRAAPGARCWNGSHELHHPSRLSLRLGPVRDQGARPTCLEWPGRHQE